MDYDLLTLVEQDGFRAVRKSTSRGGQLNGPCPFCGGIDRFRVQTNQGNYGWFACSQCEHKGNAVDYLMLKRGLSKVEALAAVGWTPKDGSALHMASPTYIYDERPQWNEPPEQWQDAARTFYQDCHHTLLHTAQGQQALAYLRSRGLTDATIKAACLGYHARETYGTVREWGRPVKLPQGIVIPWFLSGKLWRVTIRDEHIQEGEGRYTQLGGGSNGLYLADSLKLKRAITVMVEGEFDALSVAQECGKSVAVVATGTTQGSHTPRWVSLLAQQERVFIAFDSEDAGDKAAAWWLTRLSNAQRLRPWWKDANQMLQDGADLREWLASGEMPRSMSSCTQQTPVPLTNLTNPDSDEIAAFCSVCGADVERYSEHGIAFCLQHWPVCEQTSPEIPSCSSEEKQLEQFAVAVSSVAAVFGSCQIERLPIGTTLTQWLKDHPQSSPSPSLLPPLPRKQCPARCLREHLKQVTYTKQLYRSLKHEPCKQKPLKNGWCKEHQLAAVLLDLGASVGYPALQLTHYRAIEHGKASWEDYALYATQPHLKHDCERVTHFAQQQGAKRA